jgi:hypothetical protein
VQAGGTYSSVVVVVLDVVVAAALAEIRISALREGPSFLKMLDE